MENYEKFHKKRDKCIKNTLEDFQKEFEFINDLLNFYLDSAQKTSNKDKSYSDQDVAVILINIKLINSFFCLTDVIIKGFYNDASVILRQILESIYLCKHIIDNKSAVDDWMRGYKKKFNAKEKAIKEIYGDFCNFTHSNIPSIINLIVKDANFFDRTSDIILINPFPEYDEKLARKLFILHIFLIHMALNDFYEHLKKYDWINFDLEFEKRRANFNVKSALMLDLHLLDKDEI